MKKRRATRRRRHAEPAAPAQRASRRRRQPGPKPRKSAKPAVRHPPLRWNPDPEDVQRSVVKLVLSLVEFIRKLMERQAIRRVEEKTLTPEEIENVGIALMKIEETVQQIAVRFNLDPEDLNLDLGPVGRLH